MSGLTMDPQLYPVILSGGSGSRLWPVSRRLLPKPFAPLFTPNLFEQTLARTKNLGPLSIITHRDLAPLTEHSLKSTQCPAEILFEPLAKNTAPALTWACWQMRQQQRGQKTLALFPADHYIPDPAAFQMDIKKALQAAQSDKIVLLGAVPHRAETGYGYIEVASTTEEAKPVKRFHEKPHLSLALEYLQRGFYWNTGIFVGKVDVFWSLLQQHAPQLTEAFETLSPKQDNLLAVYQDLPNISIDYALIEKLNEQQLVMLPLKATWSDVGTWDSIAEQAQNSKPSFSVVGLESARNHWIGLPKKTYAAIGIEDCIIVDTEDALLITKKNHSQKVSQLQAQLIQNQPQVTERHVFEQRPWGDFKVLREENAYKTKLIRVAPKSQLSYQSHNHRTEHWVVTQGQARVILDGQPHDLKRGDYIFIGPKVKHQLINHGTEELWVVEVQIGDYLGEDDIYRYQDQYGRT